MNSAASPSFTSYNSYTSQTGSIGCKGFYISYTSHPHTPVGCGGSIGSIKHNRPRTASRFGADRREVKKTNAESVTTFTDHTDPTDPTNVTSVDSLLIDLHRATATRTGVGARGREDGRRAGRETRKRHDARTSGWHPFEGLAGPSSEGARGSHRRRQGSLARHVFLAPRNRGNRPKRHAKPPVFAEIVRSGQPPGHSKAEIFELTGPRHGAEGSTGEPKHE